MGVSVLLGRVCEEAKWLKARKETTVEENPKVIKKIFLRLLEKAPCDFKNEQKIDLGLEKNSKNHICVKVLQFLKNVRIETNTGTKSVFFPNST